MGVSNPGLSSFFEHISSVDITYPRCLYAVFVFMAIVLLFYLVKYKRRQMRILDEEMKDRHAEPANYAAVKKDVWTN